MGTPETSAPVTVPTAQFKQLRQELLNRGKKLQKEAKVYLRWVVVVLFAGLFGIVFAAYLSRLDLRARLTVATQELIETKQEELNALDERFSIPLERILGRIALTDNGRGIAVGESGIVLTTDDAGATWTRRDSGTEAPLSGVALASDGRSIAVGMSGIVLTTDDAGATWTRRDSGMGVPLSGMGVPLSGMGVPLSDVALANDGRGIVVGMSGIVLTTDDAGATWTRRDSGMGVPLSDVALANDGRGIVVGMSGIVLTTDDAGATWTRRDSGTEAPLSGVALANDGRGIVVGMSGIVLTTDDAGATWTRRDSGMGAHLYGVALANDGRGIAVGESGIVLTTDDAGATWTRRDSGMGAHLYGVALANDGRGIAVGESGIVLTTDDAGATWTKRISSEQEIRTEREILLQEIRDLEVGGVGRAESPPGSPRQPTAASEELMRTGPIRLGIIVLLLFFVQVLVGLNRYNTRLAAFYLAQADTLLLLSDGTDPVPLDAAERLIQALSPDQLDFGRTPKAVAQHAVDLARALSTRRSS